MQLFNWFLLLFVKTICKELTFDTQLTNMILVDKGYAVSHDKCSIDFFYHYDTYAEDNSETQEKHEFTANDAYFFLSWTTLNVDGYSEVVGNVFLANEPYLPLGTVNDSFLPIISTKNTADSQKNYHYVQTSDFRSKPNDIVYSFYSENQISIRVFGASKSNFLKDSFLWSPPIVVRHTNSKYAIIHQNIQCVDGNNSEFIIFVYEMDENIYKTTFNNKYIISNDMEPINNIKGIISHPLVYQSLSTSNIIITYITNYIYIQYKLYSIDTNNDNLIQINHNESTIVSTKNTTKQIKYYNIIPLSVGGYILMYSLTNNHNDEIYCVLINENGEKLFKNDMFVGIESNNTLNHGQIIELNKEISETETYILITFSIFDQGEILVGIIYSININIFAPIFSPISDMIELNTFATNGVKPNYQCINYNTLNDMIVIGWINNFHQFAYKPFYFNNNNTSHNITTQSSTSISIGKESKLIQSSLSKDMQIVVIVLCFSFFYCFLIIGITFILIYMVNTGKLRFAIGYKQINKNTKKNKDYECDDYEFENEQVLQFGDEDKSGILADDEQTVDEQTVDEQTVDQKRSNQNSKMKLKEKKINSQSI